MSVVLNVWAVTTVFAAIASAVGMLVVGLGPLYKWKPEDYRRFLMAFAAFVSAPIWPVSMVVALVLLYRHAFPKPTAADFDDEIRRMEREAGLS